MNRSADYQGDDKKMADTVYPKAARRSATDERGERSYRFPPARWFAFLACTLMFAVYSNVAAATTIPPLVTNLAAWYDASDSTSLTTGASYVVEWDDRSGNGNVLTDTTSRPPLLATAALNGQSVIDVAATPQELASTSNVGVSGNAARTLISVQYNGILNTGTDTSFGAFGFDLSLIAGPNNEYVPYTWNADNIVGTSGLANVWSIDVGTYVPGSIYGYVDGVQVGSTFSSNINTIPAPLTIGTRNPGDGQQATGEFAEILYYSYALTTTQQQYIEGYLACKWGLQSQLAAGHPYRSSCPAGDPSNSGFTGPTAWYDAAATSTLKTEPAVTQLNDKSGNGETLAFTSPTAAATGPLYVTSGLNSLGSLSFLGWNALLSNDSSFSRLLLPNSTVFLVSNAATDAQTGFALYSQNSANLRWSLSVPWNGNNHLDVGDAGANRVTVSTGTAEAMGTHLWTIAATEGGTRTWNYDGTTIASGTLPDVDSVNCSLAMGASLASGACAGSGRYYQGQIGEVLVYDRALTPPEYQYVEGYLASKWGLSGNLPAAHPWKGSSPSGVPGLTLTLAVSPGTLEPPGTDLTYTTTFTNAAGRVNYNAVITTPVPANCDFKVGSEAHAMGTTYVTATATYSSDGSAYIYTPSSGAGGAPAGYDHNVKDIRWTFSGGLAPGAPNNIGTLSFTARIQ